jgi:hypothetical protein
MAGKLGSRPSSEFIALGPTLEVVARDSSRQGAKEKAIAGGVDSPLVVRASRFNSNQESSGSTSAASRRAS